jgi:hypothetical protein
MKKTLQGLFLAVASALMGACSVFGDPGVEIIPYTVLQTEGDVEVRHYDRILMVTTPKAEGFDDNQKDPFFRLFDYISGENSVSEKIAMTAPVLMQDQAREEKQGEKIVMTAPVFMSPSEGGNTMSFVLPASYTYETAPKPKNPDVKLEEIKDYTVAVIRFSGFLSDDNIEQNRQKLSAWVEGAGYKAEGPYQVAGYNPPYTIPWLRRNEVLIPVEKKAE